MSRHLVLAPLLCSLGCAAIGGVNNSRSYQLASLGRQQIRDNNVYGYLPRSMLSGVRPEYEPRARPVKTKGDFADTFFPLSVSRVAAGTICFEKNYEPRVGLDGAAEAAALKSSWSFVVERFDTVEHAATIKTWPAPEAAHAGDVKALPTGTGWQPGRLTLEVCLPAPAVAAGDTALVVTALSHQSESQHFVLVWKIVD